MASPAQIDANRVNAQKSTGPRTPEGKAAAAQNARKEGFSSPVARLAPEQRADYERLRRALAEELNPDGALEAEFFDRLVVASWHLRLVTVLESELLAGPEDPFADDSPAAAKLARIARYRRDLERSRSRALAELRRLQTERADAERHTPGLFDGVCWRPPLDPAPGRAERQEPPPLAPLPAAPRPPVPVPKSRSALRR